MMKICYLMAYRSFMKKIGSNFMKNQSTLYLTTQAMFIAIASIMAFVPYLGMIGLGPSISLTLLHIPVLFAAYLFGWRSGLLHGTVFGLLSLLLALTRPSGLLDPFFVNPLISVLPRALFGLGAGLAFDFIRKVKKSPMSKFLFGGTSFILTLLHGLLVLTSLYLFYTQDVNAILDELAFANFWIFLGTIILTNTLLEGVVAAFLVPISAFSTQKLPSVVKLRDSYHE